MKSVRGKRTITVSLSTECHGDLEGQKWPKSWVIEGALTTFFRMSDKEKEAAVVQALIARNETMPPAVSCTSLQREGVVG